MTQATEQIARQFANSNYNRRIWGSILYDVSIYGAKGDGSDETQAIQQTINDAIANGSEYVFFPPGAYSATSLSNLDKVTIVGDNATLTVGGEDVALAPLFKPAETIKTQNICNIALSDILNVPHNSLDRAIENMIATQTLKVAFMGDSITEGADQTIVTEAYVPRVEAALKQALPDITVTVQNFALGGRTIANAVDPNFVGGDSDTATTFKRPWSVNGKAWRDHIKDFEPDIFVIAFGMNDSWAENSDEAFAAYLQSMIDYTKLWMVVPSIVVVPTILPTKNPAYYNQSQNITRSVARAAREVAKANGAVIADAGRLFEILRDGKDDVLRASYQEVGWQDYGKKWIGQTDGFTFSGNTLTPKPGLSLIFVYRNRTFYDGDISLNIKPYVEGDAGSAWIRYRYDEEIGYMLVMVGAGSGNGYVRLYNGNHSSTTLLAEITGLSIPVGAETRITIMANGPRHRVFVDGGLVIDEINLATLHDGGVNMGSAFTPPTFSDLVVNYAEPLQGLPIYTEKELLGEYNSDQSGNGINHPTGLGHAVTYLPAFYGVIQTLSKSRREESMLLPKYLKGNEFFGTPAGWTQNDADGNRLWAIAVSPPLYKKARGVALRRLDDHSYYSFNASLNAIDGLETMQTGEFAYLENISGNDFIVLGVPGGVPPSWDFELYRYV